MTTAVASELVTAAIKTLLDAELPANVKVGVGRPPNPDSDQETLTEVDPVTLESDPYVVLWGPIPIGEGPDVYLAPSYAGSPESSERLRYQIMGYARSAIGAEAVANTALGIITDRSQTTPFDWVNSIPIAGHTVYDRRKAGRIHDDEGGDIFQRGGRFELDVCVS